MSKNLAKVLFCKNFLAGLSLCLMTEMAIADQAYIKEVEGLLNSLPSKDSSRLSLSLRLADEYYNESMTLTNANMGTPTAQSKIYSHKAIVLYEECLSGFDGHFSKPSGDLRAKVQFQLARLYSDSGNAPKAEEIWKILASDNSPTDIRRESILRLAETLEKKQDAQSLEKAKHFYLLALSLCSGLDVCSYSHYRLAWVYKTQNNFDLALSEIQKALWDSKGQIREEALRDFLTFLVEKPGDGHEGLTLIEELDGKIHRSTLISDLSRGYFAAGNRQAGTYVLEHANKKNPDLKNEVTLLEEYYGFRQWTKFREGLDDALTLRDTLERNGNVSYKNDPDIEKVLRRLTVQLDGERTTAPEHSEDFKRAVMFYLSLYGNGPQRSKMIDGWLVAETNSEAKTNQLKKWISEENQGGRKKEELRLREMRASEAQKASFYGVVAEEMAAIESLSGDPLKKREASYHRAYSLYQAKSLDQALVIFKQLAQVDLLPGGSLDNWAVQSQHLALDILGSEKAYKEVLAQANSWIQNPKFEFWIAHQTNFTDDLRQMKKIAESAAFQGAVAEGTTPTALDLFKEFCDKGKEVPKSCENAQILAFKLKNEPVFIAMLKKLGKKNELITELEVSGQFGEAAESLRQQLTKTSTFKDQLKVALLFELGGDFRHRDEILKNLTTLAASKKSFGEEENLIYSTLKEANLLGLDSLKLPWSKENRTRIISDLEEKGRGSIETHKILLASCDYMGPAWEKTVLTEVKHLDEKQRKISFYGKNGKRKFEQRLGALKSLNAAGDCYLQGSTVRGRVVIATLLAKSQKVLADEILSSPIPEGLDAEVTSNIKKSLDQMASPFAAKGKSFEDLAAAQLEKITSPIEKMALKQKLNGGELSVDLLNLAESLSSENALPPPAREGSGQQLTLALAQLQQNPNERKPLENLKKYYESIGKPRLAAYFQGRINQLEVRK